jgi:hypothetical protein
MGTVPLVVGRLPGVGAWCFRVRRPLAAHGVSRRPSLSARPATTAVRAVAIARTIPTAPRSVQGTSPAARTARLFSGVTTESGETSPATAGTASQTSNTAAKRLVAARRPPAAASRTSSAPTAVLPGRMNSTTAPPKTAAPVPRAAARTDIARPGVRSGARRIGDASAETRGALTEAANWSRPLEGCEGARHAADRNQSWKVVA